MRASSSRAPDKPFARKPQRLVGLAMPGLRHRQRIGRGLLLVLRDVDLVVERDPLLLERLGRCRQPLDLRRDLGPPLVERRDLRRRALAPPLPVAGFARDLLRAAPARIRAADSNEPSFSRA